jgi:hypothetical protein
MLATGLVGALLVVVWPLIPAAIVVLVVLGVVG